MASPSTAITRLDLSLSYTEFGLAANQAKFIGMRVMPPLGVDQEAADFQKIQLASLLTKIEDTRRAPKTGYARDDFDWTTDSYVVDEHGVEEVVDDATVERYGDVIRAETVATMRGVNRVLQRLEYDIAQATQLAGNAGSTSDVDTANSYSGGTTSGEKWSVKASADPIADVDLAHEELSAQCGEDANALVLTKEAFRSMIRTDRLEGLLKYDASELMIALNNGQNQAMVSEIVSGIKDLLQVETILIGRGFHNTADRGQSASLARQWDTTKANLMVIRDDGLNGDLENPMPQFGRLIVSTKNSEPLPGAGDAGLGSLIFDEYREEQVRGSVIRPRNKRQVKVLHTACNHLMTNVL